MLLTTHVFRHFYVGILVRIGESLKIMVYGLGHASVVTTDKYFEGGALSRQANFAEASINF